LAGNPDDDEEAWSVREFDRLDGVSMAFAVGADPPAIADELWTDGADRPATAVLKTDGEPVAEVVVQPRAPLPGGSFVPSVVTGLVPMEERLDTLPSVGKPVTDALFIDPDEPDADSYSSPYGVVVLFSEDAETLREQFYTEYGIKHGVDSRPQYDPYGM